MNNRESIGPLSIAAIGGLILWLAASLISGKREAWDSAVYWTAAYPAAIAISAFLGYWRPERPWRWVLVLFEVQLAAMFIRGGEVGSLWPIGMIVLAIIAIPGMAAAKISARIRVRQQQSK